MCNCMYNLQTSLCCTVYQHTSCYDAQCGHAGTQHQASARAGDADGRRGHGLLYHGTRVVYVEHASCCGKAVASAPCSHRYRCRYRQRYAPPYRGQAMALASALCTAVPHIEQRRAAAPSLRLPSCLSGGSQSSPPGSLAPSPESRRLPRPGPNVGSAFRRSGAQ